MQGFAQDKSVPCLFSTCLDFGGSCEDIVRVLIHIRKKPKFYSSTVVYFTLADLLEVSSGIVIGAFRSILLLFILMLTNKQAFQSFWLFLAEQKYVFVFLHNSNLHRRTRVHNLTKIDDTLKP